MAASGILKHSGSLKESQVRFIRAEQPTDDPTLLSARIEYEREQIRAKKGRRTPPSGSRKPRKVRSVVYRYERSASIVAWVLEQARGSCEGCLNVGPFIDDKREHYLEVHHIRTLAEGGPDTVDNAAALCPACHRELHYGLERDVQRTRLLNQIERLVDHPCRTQE
ncbi:HNH endonuclease [Rhizobium leguminosarum]|uniref:HNH endonuclease n=1 Tax=Rhizobium leguminosarum TaxID=384 RepID=UPI003AF30BD9